MNWLKFVPGVGWLFEKWRLLRESLDLAHKLELARKDKLIAELQEKLEARGKLTFAPPYYFMEGDPHPYCARCWEDERKAIHLGQLGGLNGGKCRACPKCKEKFWEELPPAPRRVASKSNFWKTSPWS